jgi:hypothetical protein
MRSELSSKKFVTEDATNGVSQGHQRVPGKQMMIVGYGIAKKPFVHCLRPRPADGGVVVIVEFQEKINSESVFDESWTGRKWPSF